MIQISDMQWAFDVFTKLSERCGVEVLLGAPLILPTAACFPDELSDGALGARQLTRRMMRHAGLGHLEVDLFADPAEEFRSPIDFEGIGPASTDLTSEGSAAFSYHEDWKADVTTGFLCFEVAQAFRAHHGVTFSTGEQWDSGDTSDIDALAAATAVFLGFGVLALNAADNYEQGGHLDGNMVVSRWLRTRAGALAVDELAALLALWTILRGSSEGERKVVAKHLSVNQAAAFRKARKGLSRYTRDEIRSRAGLEAGDDFVIRPVDTRELEVEDQDADLVEAEADALHQSARTEAQRLVYRVVGGREFALGCGMTVVAFAAAVITTITLRDSTGLVVGGVIVVIGAFLGFRKQVFCSDGECRTKMKLDDVRCPGCHARVAGDVASRAEALDLPRYAQEQSYREPGR